MKDKSISGRESSCPKISMKRETPKKNRPWKKPWLAILLLLLTALLLTACGEDKSIEELAAEAAKNSPSLPFTETFADNSKGWILGPEWQIGPALTHVPTNGNSDPGTDVTPTADNGIAGVAIGGEYIVPAVHPYYYLTSPVIDASGVSGTLNFSYYRWLNTDYNNFVDNSVEVFDGVSWVILWQGPLCCTAIFDSTWNPITFDITAFANANLQVRFGFNIGSISVFAAGGWNVDDVTIQ